MARLGWLQGLFPRYGKDAFEAATFSRQLPRFNKPVEMLGLLAWTRVQLPPSPKALGNFFFSFGCFFYFLTLFADVEKPSSGASKAISTLSIISSFKKSRSLEKSIKS